jgi:2-dehydro-3-deoxygluconokinase
VEKAMDIARRNKVQISFDPNLRLRICRSEKAVPIILKLIPQADIILPGLEEAQILLGEKEPEKIVDHLLKMGPSLIALKLGPKGVLIADRHRQCHVPAFPVTRVVDPFGAGDAFAAGFLAGILENMSLEEAGRLGNAAGAFALSVTGNIEAYPFREEILAFLQGKEKVNR